MQFYLKYFWGLNMASYLTMDIILSVESKPMFGLKHIQKIKLLVLKSFIHVTILQTHPSGSDVYHLKQCFLASSSLATCDE